MINVLERYVFFYFRSRFGFFFFMVEGGIMIMDIISKGIFNIGNFIEVCSVIYYLRL